MKSKKRVLKILALIISMVMMLSGCNAESEGAERLARITQTLTGKAELK